MQQTLTRILMITVLIVGAWVPAHAAGSGYYDLGVFAYEDGDYAVAEGYFLKSLESNPYNIDVYHYLGRTYLRLEQAQKADHYLMIVEKMEPGRAGLTADLALLNMKEGNYEKAVFLFDKVSKADPEDVLAVYRAGICAYRMGRFKDALSRLARSAEMSPSVKPNADYYSGICAFRLNDMDKAFEKFTTARFAAASDTLKKDAEKWLKIISAEKAAMKPYSLYASLGVTYDDNVVLDPVDTDVFNDQGDISAVAYLSGRYNLVNRRYLKAGIGYSHYQTHHSRWRDYDLAGSIGDFFINYRVKGYKLGLTYSPSYYWVRANSFLARNDLSPEVTWQVDEKTAATFSYTFRRNNYFTDPARDGHANVVSLDLIRALPKNAGTITGGIGYEKNFAKSNDEDYGQLEARLGLNWQVMDKTILSISGIYDAKAYESTDSIFGIKRDDDRYYGAVSITRSVFYDWLSISVDLDHTFNDSNIKYYEYRRNTVSFSVSANL
ncbi:MAG: tetratricopeptide repeat protein [Deltaproteobacteria bacterium]|nr:tetratricopeptide repeat protein [Deltaproteobacteria bacterium]